MRSGQIFLFLNGCYQRKTEKKILGRIQNGKINFFSKILFLPVKIPFFIYIGNGELGFAGEN
jgi:hypothetical protein